MPTPRTADALFEGLRSHRDCGVVRAGLAEATVLSTATAEFQLSTDDAIYRCIDVDVARRVLIRILHRDLAYDAEIMPLADAERLAAEVLLLVPDAQLFTNGSYGDPTAPATNGVRVGPSWNPATSATFDTGVIAITLRDETTNEGRMVRVAWRERSNLRRSPPRF